MAWGIGIFIVLILFTYPQQMLSIIAILTILIFSLFKYEKINSEKREKEESWVTIEIEYNLSRCNKETPLLISINNLGHKIVRKVHWSIGVYREGYSSNLIQNNNSSYYSSDKILSHAQHISMCWGLPNITKKSNISDLKYLITSKSVQFY